MPSDMEAGRELDTLVAEKVMGWPHIEWGPRAPCPACGDKMRWCGTRARCSACGEWRYGPHPEFSGDIAAAWGVVEALRRRGYACGIDVMTLDGGRLVEVGFFLFGTGRVAQAIAPTAPLAICRAALAAMGGDDAE